MHSHRKSMLITLLRMLLNPANAGYVERLSAGLFRPAEFLAERGHRDLARKFVLLRDQVLDTGGHTIRPAFVQADRVPSDIFDILPRNLNPWGWIRKAPPWF